MCLVTGLNKPEIIMNEQEKLNNQKLSLCLSEKNIFKSNAMTGTVIMAGEIV
jgi:hypothetical protein